MGKVDNTALQCEIKVQKYSLIVNELQATENRNDEFLKKLLAHTEQLEVQKVDKNAYGTDQQRLIMKLEAFERYNRENHVHYV